MPLTYRRPGVYLEESLLVNPSEVSGAVTVACFVGAASQGPINEPTLVESWSDFVTLFGGFGAFAVPDDPPGTVKPSALSYLPYAIYSFFQNGGRTAWVIRAVPTEEAKNGDPAEIVVNGTDDEGDPLDAFTILARSVGTWGNNIKYEIARQNAGGDPESVFTLRVLMTNADGANEVVETFSSLSMKGEIPGTRKADAAVNDPFSGSQYIALVGMNELQPGPEVTTNPVALAGGVDPFLPDAADLQSAAQLVAKVEGPVNLNIVGYLEDASKMETSEASGVWVGTTLPSSFIPDRQDIFIINDNAPPRAPGQSSASYKAAIQNSTALGANLGDSYSASYGPWVIIPNPQRVGTTLSVPPGGGVAGVMARIDATIGVFRAPAGVIAGLSNAVGVQTKFTDTELGDLNASNINAIGALFELAGGFEPTVAFSRADVAIAAAKAASDVAPWDLMLMDIEMPGMDGIAATAAMKEVLPGVPVVMLTSFEDPDRILAAIRAGADGYLLKRSDPNDIVAEVKSVAAGGSPLTPSVARSILAHVRTGTHRPTVPAKSEWNLSEREMDVLRQLVEGLSYKQIADKLCVSIDTVRTHLRHVYRKMQVHSAGEAISRAIKSGVVS